MRARIVFCLALLLGCGSDGSTGPSIAPAGEIAYSRVTGSDYASAAIYIIGEDGQGNRLLVDIPGGPDIPADWSPDGRTLLFTHEDRGTLSLWLVQNDETSLRQLPTPGGVDNPDGYPARGASRSAGTRAPAAATTCFHGGPPTAHGSSMSPTRLRRPIGSASAS